jgi:PKD repeat protein
VAAGHCSEGSGTEPLCSYHSFTTVNSSTVLYAVVPTTQITACQDGASLEEPNLLPADVTVNEIADEQIATATDPQLNGWVGTLGEEVPDKCRYDFDPFLGLAGKFWNQTIEGTHYYLNDEFNQAGLTEAYPGSHCLNTVTEEPQFTAPTTVHPGDPVTFNTTASRVDLGIAKYNWEFGPGETAEVNCEGRTPTYGKTPAECNAALVGTGNPNSVASVVHKYARSGSYEVKLTVIDDGGNSAEATHRITVVPTQQEEEEARANAKREAEENAKREAVERAKREAEEKAKREAEEKAKSPAAVESAKRAAEAKAGVPVATTRVLSRSLKTALSSGLTVRYSVNEQVTGSFEVLLASSVARQIGLHGTPATGLPAGSAPQIVIAKAILVTIAGGHNTVKILFGKKTAALLHKLHKVSLMVRLVVRNASSRTPVSTTVVSVVTLTH